MKKITAFSLVLLFFVAAYAQPTFQKYYFTSVTDKFGQLNVLSDGSILISRQTITEKRKYFELIKTDSNGDTLWTRAGYDSLITRYYHTKQTAGDQFYFAGFRQDSISMTRSGALLKGDASGNILWSKYYPDTIIQKINFVEILSDGNLLLMGVSTKAPNPNFGRAVLLKTDSTGNIIWSSYSAFIANEYIQGVEMPDHGYVVMQNYGGSSSVLRFDSTGLLLWTRSGSGVAIKRNPVTVIDTMMVSVCFYPNSWITVFKYDFAGNQVSMNTFPFPELKEVNEIIPTSDFGYLVCGVKYDDFYNSDAVFYKVDSAFNILWRRELSNYSLENGTTAIETMNHSFYVMANVNSFTSNVKGFSITGLDSLGIIMNSNLQANEQPSCNIFPNPFSVSMTLSIDNPNNKLYSVSIYNVLGKEVCRKEFNSASVLINRNNFSQGIYFYRVSENNLLIATGKVVVE